MTVKIIPKPRGSHLERTRKSYDHDNYFANALNRIGLRPFGETRRNAYDVESTVLTTFRQKKQLAYDLLAITNTEHVAYDPCGKMEKKALVVGSGA